MYDELSRRISMTDGTGTSTYTYDRMSRLTQSAQPNGTLSYAYDLDSNRTTLTYPGSNVVAYTFSNAGRLSSLQDWASRTTSYSYTPAGRAATASLPGGLVATYTYDRAQRLTALTNVVGSTTITSHSYTLDSVGNRTAQAEFVSGITTGSSDSLGYTYDGLNRLVAVTTTNAETFTLDSASNIASRTGPSATFSYDASNRLTGDGSQTFTWSTADRLTARGSDSFGYDPLDRLTSSTLSGTSRTYAYSGDSLLQSRTQGSTTNLLWDPTTSPSRLLQIGSDKIVYGLGLAYVITGLGTTTFARDGGKSVRAELSGSGAVTATFRYRAYGQVAQSTGASTPTYFGFASQLLDPSGLYYMRARWYDGASGRFLSRDPLKGDSVNPGSLNSFNYASGDPVGLSDPSGACPVSLECAAWWGLAIVQGPDEADAAVRAALSGNGAIAATGYVELSAGLVAAVAGAIPLATEMAVNGSAAINRIAAASNLETQVILDTNAVIRYQNAAAMLVEDEVAVTTRTTQAELANLVARGEGVYMPRAAANITTIDDVMDVDLRINLRGAIGPSRGLFGDGSIGATAIRTGLTLITNDGDLATAVTDLGGSVRRLL
jgi:RHS repeat-associated protein